MKQTLSYLRLKVRRLKTCRHPYFAFIIQYGIYAFALKFSQVTHKIMLLEKCLAPY